MRWLTLRQRKGARAGDAGGHERPSPARAVKLGWRRRLIDTYIDSYVDWRERCAEVRAAYRRWALARPSDCAVAFLAYRAALEREEQAALAHRLAVARLARHARRS